MLYRGSKPSRGRRGCIEAVNPSGGCIEAVNPSRGRRGFIEAVNLQG